MNYAGTFEFLDSTDAPAGTAGGAHPIGADSSHTAAAPSIIVNDANLLFSGDYKRSGVDLVLSKDGHEHTVFDYFKGSLRAALSSPDGAILSADLIKALIGEVQVAQLGGANAAAQEIGTVTKLTGSATAIRNGVSVMLNVGDKVQKGDVVQAGADSSLGLTFIDGTVFGLSSNARMVLNEMVYDPNGSSNSSLLSLVQGTITFVAGETAKHGDMRVDTPVATMGIRGTAVLVEIGFEVTGTTGVPVKFQVLVEPGGRVGSYVLYSKSDPTQVIGTVNQAGQVTSVAGNGVTSVTAADPLPPIAQGIIQQTLQQYFPNYVPNANPRSNGSSGGSTPSDPVPDKIDKLPNLRIDEPNVVPISVPSTVPGGSPTTVNVTVTPHNTAPTIEVTPVVVTLPVDQATFKLGDRVAITDPDATNPTFNDVAEPYVAGSGRVTAANGPGHGPNGAALTSLVTVDSQTGAVTYDAAAFRFLGAGEKAVYTIEFDSRSGPDTVHETMTVTINGVNDAPVVTSAQVSIAEGGIALLNAANFVVTDPDGSTSFSFKVSNVTHGTFQVTADGVTWTDATSFTTADLNAGHVRFVHDGSEAAPTFSVQADDDATTNNLSDVATGSVTFVNVNDAPVISSASLNIGEGGTVILNAANINVTDPDSTTFTFKVSNVTHGVFQVSTNGVTWTDATSFTTADLDAGHVRFVHDGGEAAPTFSVQADDGATTNNLSDVATGSVIFVNVNDAPVVSSASLSISEGGTVILSAANIGVTDPDGTNFTFKVSNVTHGVFQVSTNGVTWTDATSFTTADLNAGHVRFVHDGGEAAPAFSVQADDGATTNNLSDVATGSVTFLNVNDAPVISSALLNIGEGGTVILNAANIGVTDPDSADFTFKVSNVTHGVFQVSTNGVTWTDAASFTTADLDAGHVRFVHDGGEAAPTFSVQADDGATTNNLSDVATGSVTFLNVNDAPVIASASLSISEGGTVILNAANIGVTDPDSTSFAFKVSNVTHGVFQVSTNGVTWTDATSFTTADLNAGHVRFVHDGGEAAPTFSIQADDGAATNNLSNVTSASVNFTNVNDAPVITSASLAVSQGGTVIVKVSDVSISDPDSSSFTYYAAATHGAFERFNGVTWVAIVTGAAVTSADIAAGLIRFHHDGSSFPPEIAVIVGDGSATSAPFLATVAFTLVNSAPVVTASLNVSEGGTVVLSPANITVIDPDSSSFTFKIINLSHGTVQVSVDGQDWSNASTFTSADLAAGHVRFVHDGSEFMPSFSIQADDGASANNLSAISPVAVLYAPVNDAPIISSASLTVDEGGIAILTPASIGVTDSDNSSFTFKVSNVAHGSFQVLIETSWVAATSFTSADLAAGHVRFVHDGGEAAPTFSIQADDAMPTNHLSNIVDGTVTFHNVNDAPVITSASLTMPQDGSVIIHLSDVGITDPDSTSFTFYATATHGVFERYDGEVWTEVTSDDPVTSADIAEGLVRFHHDGSSNAPDIMIIVSDGSAYSDPFHVAVDFTQSGSSFQLTSSAGTSIDVSQYGATSGFVLPGAGNVTTPGTPEDRIVLGYDAGGHHFVLNGAPMMGNTDFTRISNTLTHHNDGSSSATTVLGAGDGITLTQTITLGADANFFTTTIDIFNNSGATIDNVRFMRNFDPDQDVANYSSFYTNNDVIHNPAGADDVAIVSAKGYYSHSDVALIGLGGDWRASSFGFTNTDPYMASAYDAPYDPNGATGDTAISLTNGFGSIANGQHATVTYITTNNVATAGNNALYGTEGADTINGQGGNDLLIGLGGADNFVFSANSGHDTIFDFQQNTDHIDLSAVVATNDVEAWMRQHVSASPLNEADTLISLDSGDTILLHKVTYTTLSASDFIVHNTMPV